MGTERKWIRFNNSLIWSYDLQKFTLIPGTFQSRPPKTLEIEFLKQSTQKLILGSRLRVILMCGDKVERIVLPDTISSSGQIIILLNHVEFHAWVERDGCKIRRLFIRSPSPISELWASHGRVAYQITSVFQFISEITDVKLRSAFYELTLAVALILRS